MEQKDTLKKTSRLQVLGRLFIGIVAAQAAPVFAEQLSTPANQQGTSSQEHPTSLSGRTQLSNIQVRPFPGNRRSDPIMVRKVIRVMDS